MRGLQPKPEETGARAAIRECALVCTYLFGIARAIQELRIQNTEFLVTGACQTSHLGQNRIKQSYKSKR